MLVVALVLCALAMMSIVTENVITQRAATTALFVDSVVSPHLQELATTTLVSPETGAFLDDVMQQPAFISRFPYLDVWLSDGTIAYSNSHEIIGRRFPLPPGVKQALQGQVIASFTELGTEEHVGRHFKDDYSEIYIPVYLDKAGEVIGVAEIHELTVTLPPTSIQPEGDSGGCFGRSGRGELRGLAQSWSLSGAADPVAG
jgi:hypothetical protein